MDGAAAGLVLCLFGAVLARRDLRGIVRRLTWRRAMATIRFEPGPSWRIDYMLADGVPVSVVTRDLRLLARREGDGPVTLLVDPRAPGRVDLPGRPGLGLACGAWLVGLGLVALLR
ncbi:hypothetical protein [Roseomonas fluvialis]|uniref:DUF3592 domain-containing protein n=1 Tax=Roseomonas fluvialis TaxID=1750527 RepID=A0ABN6NY65_9PROT|nr:hypothetical protein [Roseomonas fluvialis]BDG70995.1 hypothetical protein Rmf_09240 [Roseomonas fluvialis]